MPARRRVAVDAVDVYARGAIDRIPHRIDVEFSGHAVFGAEYRHELDAGRFGENIDRPAALGIETSLVGDNTDYARGGLVGTPDLPETILFEDVDPVQHDYIVWGWSMRSNLWPAGTISGGCAIRYSGLRAGGYKQGSTEGHEKNDSGTHAGIVVAIAPGVSERFCCDSLGGVTPGHTCSQDSLWAKLSVIRDPQIAASWYRKAASAGNALGENNGRYVSKR